MIYLFDQVIAKGLIAVGHQILLGLVLVGMVLVAPNGLLRPPETPRGRAPPC